MLRKTDVENEIVMFETYKQAFDHWIHINEFANSQNKILTEIEKGKKLVETIQEEKEDHTEEDLIDDQGNTNLQPEEILTDFNFSNLESGLQDQIDNLNEGQRYVLNHVMTRIDHQVNCMGKENPNCNHSAPNLNEPIRMICSGVGGTGNIHFNV